MIFVCVKILQTKLLWGREYTEFDNLFKLFCIDQVWLLMVWSITTAGP